MKNASVRVMLEAKLPFHELEHASPNEACSPTRNIYFCLVVDPPRRVVLTWGHAGSDVFPPGSFRVEITLTPTEEGTLLSVEHRDLPPEQTPQHAIGWPHFLNRLAQAATGRNPGPDPFATRGADTGATEPHS